MAPYRVSASIALAALVTAASPTNADEIQIDGETLLISPPDGYCNLDRRQPSDAEWIEFMERFQENRRVILYMMRCGELEDRRNGKSTLDGHVGFVFVPLESGAVARIDASRADYIAQIQASVPLIDQARVEQLLNGEFAQGRSLRASGLLEADENAAYFGEITGRSGIYILASTIVRGLAVWVELFESGEPAGFEPPMALLRPYMAKLVEENP